MSDLGAQDVTDSPPMGAACATPQLCMRTMPCSSFIHLFLGRQSHRSTGEEHHIPTSLQFLDSIKSAQNKCPFGLRLAFPGVYQMPHMDCYSLSLNFILYYKKRAKASPCANVLTSTKRTFCILTICSTH